MTEQCNKDPRLCWSVRCQLGKKCIGGQATAVQPVAIVVPHEATVRLEWASVKAAHNAKPGPLYARAAVEAAQPEAVGAEMLECLAVDIEAIDVMYRGDPIYEHDGYWMRKEAAKAVRDLARRLASAQTPEPMSAPTAEPVGLTDSDLERMFERAGGKWNGDMWTIEDADFHPAMRSLISKSKATPPSAATPEPSDAERDDPLQGAVDWFLQADGEFFCVATVQRTLRIGYNRAKRLCDVAKERATKGGKL